MAPSRRQISKNESQNDLSSAFGSKDTTPSHILYDLNIFSEWSQDIENKNRPTKETTASGFAGKLYSTAQRSVWTFLRSVGVQTRTTSPCNLPVSLVKLVNIKLTWSICLSPDAEYLAVLQEASVEVRCRRDNYATTIGKAKLLEDEELQWRRMAWSDDSQLLAVSFSTGAVTVLDIMCGEFFTIYQQPKVAVSVGDLSSAIAAMIFSRPSKGTDEKWDFNLTIINHQGLLTCYLLSTEEGVYEEVHKFQFSSTYPQGVSSAVYSEKHALLVVTGLASPSTDLLKTKAGQEGITAWRVLSGSPYYKRVTDYEEDKLNSGGQGFLKKFRSAMYGAIYGDGMQELVLKSCLSPDGKYLLTLSTESKLCLYQMPSLMLIHSWSADQQPCGDQLSPTLAESPRKTKYLQEHPHYYKLLDIAWWSDKEVILARYSGAVLVADIENLSNLLGEFPEWFEVCPQIQEAHEGGFLSLECESRVLSSSRMRTLGEGTTPAEESDSDEDESSSLMSKTNRVFRETLFYITDMDRFEPPKKKTRLIKKTYRLVSLKSTTPDELFARKIDQEEYGEALVLAKLYHLDSDLVYQRQWRKSNVTLATIHDYLSKIRKRSWVLHECLERVPNNIDAMRELLQYGLRGTDLEALVKIGQGRDKGRFIVSKDIQLDESYDEYDQESVDELEAMRTQHRHNLLDQLDFDNLTLEQKELCRVRLKLLTYLDRLATYEEILGGGRVAEEHFDAKFFQKFRSQNVVEAITDYAQIGDPKAVDMMFIFLGKHTLTHRLAILSNFPETLPPAEYADLLPVVEDGEVVDYPQESLREPDWCELPKRRTAIEGANAHSAEFLYEGNKTLLPFCDQSLTPRLLTQWYQVRSCDIEERSRLVDHALEFIELGMKNGVEDLQSLWEDLSVMEMIVYDCNYGDNLSFKQLQEMNDLNRLKTIMSKTTREKYALHIQKWMRPFLERCEAKGAGSYQPLLLQYLIDLSANDLELVFKVFECSKTDQPARQRLLNTEQRLLNAAVDCIYACERGDQLSYVLSILECLPNRKSGSMERSLVKLHNDVDELEVLITAAEILETYGISMTISALKDTQNDVDAATLLMKKLTRRANNREPGLTTAEWTQLQSDMSVLQSKVYRCIDKYTCCEIFVESLLCSGKKESIELSLVYMESDMESSTHSMTSSTTGSLIDSQIPFEQAIDIVVRAAREYFNSSGSHSDYNMQLADSCLRLFPATHAKIKEELDLIQALPLLVDFGMTMIPLRVRLCENRLELIEEALRSSRTAYKQYPKLLKLADGLRVSECAVLQLIVREALTQGDSKFAYKHCKSLIDKEYPDIWSECYQLACSTQFTDIDARMALLSYSLVHCSDDMIEEVLAERMALKTEILVTRMQSTAHQRGSSPSKPDTQVSETDGQGQSKSDWQTLFSAEAAVGALTKTTRHTKTLLSNLGDMKWIDKTVSLISGRSVDSDMDKGAEFVVQGCHPFYEDIISGCQPSIELGGSRRLEMSFSEDVLRTRKLQESLCKGGDVIEDCSEVLVNCAIHALPVDITLGLGFLVALPKSGEADSCFVQLPHVPLTLRLGAYYYALQLLSSLSMSVHGSVSETISLAQQVPQHQLTEESNKALFEKLDLYVRLMEDHSQACYLQSLGKDVDSHRFTADNDYKRQTILSLTKSMDQMHYDTAISMAKRYSVSFWDVYMTHLEYILVESGLTAGQADKKIERLNMIKELLSEPDKFADHMRSNVLPHIEGRDMAKLQLYYKLVDGCPCSDNVSFDTHRKLLSKLIPAAPGLDYGALMDGSADAVAILRPVLKSGNVHVFSKLSTKIPTADGGHLSSSAVFNAWAQKLFTDGASANSKAPDSTAAWVHRYESCGEYVAKMEACDNISFLKHALFCEHSLDKVPLDARQEICRRNMKHCRSNTGKSTSPRMTWTEALQATQQFEEHLERMGCEALIGLRLAEDVQVQSYHKKIDSCMSDPDKLRDVLVDMLLDGQVLELVHDILQVIPIHGWTVRDALNAAMLVICKHLREREQHLISNGKQTLKAFENLIGQVGEHQKEGGELVSSEDVMSLFRPLIPDTRIEMETRLLALNLLEENFELTEDDKLMVLLYQTQAITLTHWPEKEVSDKDVCSEQARIDLFMQFLDSTKIEQFLSLPSLINVWPKMKDVNSLWISLLDAVLTKVEDEGAENIVTLCLTESLPQGVVQHAYSTLKASEYLHQAAMLAICSLSPVLQDDLTEMMCEQSEVFADDDVVLRAVFEHHLLVNFVDTQLFKPLVDYLTHHQKETDFLEPNIVINELLQAKYANEATEVDKACRGQKGLRTLGAAAGAISAISRWWRKD